MARSAQSKLKSILEKQRRAEEAHLRAGEELKKVLAPTIAKITGVAQGAADGFVRDNMMRLDEIEIDPKALQAAFRAVLEEQLLAGRSSARESQEVASNTAKDTAPVSTGGESALELE